MYYRGLFLKSIQDGIMITIYQIYFEFCESRSFSKLDCWGPLVTLGEGQWCKEKSEGGKNLNFLLKKHVSLRKSQLLEIQNKNSKIF